VLVRCSLSELQEYGEVIDVGRRIARPGLPRSGGERFFGTSVDDVPWDLDRYHFLVATPSVTIAGLVIAIDGVYARVQRRDDGWGPEPGSARLEPVRSTAESRRIEPRIRRQEWTGADGRARRGGSYSPEEGDEQHYGWVLTLEDVSTEPLD
jgi:hypothetical protein